jgi:hypothetical protein
VTSYDYTPYAEDLACRHALAEQLRIPLIRNPYPRWRYTTAIVVSDDLWHGLMPTDDELRMVGSFHEEYSVYFLGPDADRGYRARLAQRPYDIEGKPGRFLIKHRNGGWGYRRTTWEYGPEFVPEWNAEPEGLEKVLDRVHTIGDKVLNHWAEWKAANPDVFAPSPTANL